MTAIVVAKPVKLMAPSASMKAAETGVILVKAVFITTSSSTKLFINTTVTLVSYTVPLFMLKSSLGLSFPESAVTNALLKLIETSSHVTVATDLSLVHSIASMAALFVRTKLAASLLVLSASYLISSCAAASFFFTLDSSSFSSSPSLSESVSSSDSLSLSYAS